MDAAINTTFLVSSLAIGGIALSGIAFLVYSIICSRKLTLNGFLLSNRKLSGDAYANTYSATNISLAGNIIFFLSAHQLYGWMMGLAIVVYTIVQFYILHTAKKVNLDFNKIRTVSDLWFSVFPSTKVARIMSATIVFGCLFGLFLELYFGSVILSMFFPDESIYKAGSFFMLGLLVICYVYFGGFTAIVKTDKWQIGLLLLASAALLYFSLSVPNYGAAAESTSLFSKLFGHQESGVPLLTFLVWVIALNILLCFIDISTWQRMNAVVSIDAATKGLIKGLWKLAIVFCVPMMAIVLLGAKGYSFSTIPEFLNIIFNHSGKLSVIIFPIVVVGFSAALFSTADTILISAIYGLCDHNTLLPFLEKIDESKKHNILRNYLVLFTLGIILLLSILYYIQGQAISDFIMPAIYSTWGVLIGMAIFPIYAFHRMKKGLPTLKATKKSEAIILFFLFIAVGITLAGSILEYRTDKMIYSQVANLCTVVTIIIGIATCVYSEARETKTITKFKLNHGYNS